MTAAEKASLAFKSQKAEREDFAEGPEGNMFREIQREDITCHPRNNTSLLEPKFDLLSVYTCPVKVGCEKLKASSQKGTQNRIVVVKLTEKTFCIVK